MRAHALPLHRLRVGGLSLDVVFCVLISAITLISTLA